MGARAGILTKIVVFGLLIYLSTYLLNLQSQIAETEAEEARLAQEVLEQTQINAQLADDIANSDDPERIQSIAREKLGLVLPGEKIFIASD